MQRSGGFVGRAAVAALAVLSIVALVAAPADAAFPGKNGKIAFVSDRDGADDIFAMNADGTGLVNVTQDPAVDIHPAWSPDGTKIAFGWNTGGNYNIWVMNPDGTHRVRLTNDPAADFGPAWSPDGQKLAFVSDRDNPGGGMCTTCDEIYVMNADGSNQTQLTNTSSNSYEPAWSPDGTKIAFATDRDSVSEVYLMNADGSNQTQLTNTSSNGSEPVWSPDGSRIAFTRTSCGFEGCWSDIYVMNRDGTGQVKLTDFGYPVSGGTPAWSPDGQQIVFSESCFVSGCFGSDIVAMNADGTNQHNLTSGVTSGANDDDPDWQPLPINYYPRPKGATPFATYLTVAYKPCTSANEQHGAPLSSDSCSPPQQASDYLTVGTLDSNGQKANSIGSVRYDVKLASPADVKLAVSILDVRNKSDLSDYTGELLETSLRRITDQNNTPAPDGTTRAATVEDIPFSATVPCAATTDTTIGSTCALATTANALVPGQVVQNMRSIWQLDQVQVYDGGADATATTADNTLFMDEGIFVP